MPRNRCGRHGNSPCSCGMGNIYRFVEPVVLFLLKTKGHAHGYELARDMTDCSLTDAAIDLGGLYRVLQRLEVEEIVASEWDTSGSGPARRVYSITSAGEYRLREWVTVIGNMSRSMDAFLRRAKGSNIEPLSDLPEANADGSDTAAAGDSKE